MDAENLRALATDGVVVFDGEVALIERSHPPQEGHWVLPGGLVEREETAREACAREVREEIGVDADPVAFVGLYDDPDRDERGNVSAAYRCRPRGEASPEAREEARRVATFPPDDLPEMGFDHARIVVDAFEDA
ncbi:MAG: NUDIX domain-containing protein [Salinigranum sp.]